MPYPSQIDRQAIVETARMMIESSGVENLNLRDLAKELGVKAPSLYRYVANKTALLRAVNDLTTRSLSEALHHVVDETQTEDFLPRMMRVAIAFRQFVHDHPACYMLYANTLRDDTRPDFDERVQAVLPLQRVIASAVGEDDSLAAIRGAYAFLHGWVILEITEQFERGGDLDSHFEQALEAYFSGWQS